MELVGLPFQSVRLEDLATQFMLNRIYLLFQLLDVQTFLFIASPELLNLNVFLL